MDNNFDLLSEDLTTLDDFAFDDTQIVDLDDIGTSNTTTEIDDLDSLVFDMNMDEIQSLETIEETKSNIKTLPFGCKFFINYLGLNPLTIYKESTDVALTVIKSQLDRLKLLQLQSNIIGYTDTLNDVKADGFIDYMNIQKVKVLSDSEVSQEDKELVINITNTFLNKWQVYNEFINSICFKVDEFEISQKLKSVIVEAGNNINPLQKVSKEIRNIMNDLLFHPNDDFINYIIGVYKSEKETVNSIKELETNTSKNKVTTFEFFENTERTANEKIEEYINKNYSYTPKELKYLKLLGFPTSIAFNESYLKNNVLTPKDIIAKNTVKYNTSKQYSQLGYNTVSRAISDLSTLQRLRKDLRDNNSYIGIKF